MILHRPVVGLRMGVELFADRFVVDDGHVRDLVTGARVTLVTSVAGARAEQHQWLSRCDRLVRLRHPSIASLIDYGIVGEMRRFEAWWCGPPWQGPRIVGARARAMAQHVLAAAGLSSAGERDGVHEAAGRPVLLPSDDTGHERPPGSASPVALPVEAYALTLIDRPAVAIAAEWMDRASRTTRPLAVFGAPGSGVLTTTLAIARLARTHGFIPVAAELTDDRTCALLDGRSLLLIARGASGRWTAPLSWALRSPGRT